MKQSILILGANGFIGQGLLGHFKKIGFHTIGISKDQKNSEVTHHADLSFSFKLPSSHLAEVITAHKPDFIVNATGKSNVSFSFTNPEEDFLENTNVTFQVLNLLREFSKETKFIYLSSASVYGNPTNLPVSEIAMVNPISAYGYHKYIGELICEEYSKLFGIKTASLRIFSAYGPGLKKQVIFDLCRKLFFDDSVSLFGTGNESRDFIHISDITRAIEMIILKGNLSGERYNLASGTEITIRELSSKIKNFSGLDKEIVFSNEIHEGSPLNWRADISRIIELGYTNSIDIDTGLEEYVSWFKKTQLS